MSYQLKTNQPPFSPVEGEFSGRLFTHGQIYPEVPAAEKARFEKIRQASAAGNTGDTGKEATK